MPKRRKKGGKSAKRLKPADLDRKNAILKERLKKIVSEGFDYIKKEGLKLIQKKSNEHKSFEDEFRFISGIKFNPYYDVNYADLTIVYGRLLFTYFIRILSPKQSAEVLKALVEIGFDEYTALWSVEELFNRIGRRVSKLAVEGFDEAIFEDEWEKFYSSYLRQSPLEYVISFPVSNLHLEVQEVQLNETSKIRLLTSEEKYFWGIRDLPDISTCIELKLNLKYLIKREVAEALHGEIFELVDNVILLLNLVFSCNTRVSNKIFLENEPIYFRRPPLLAPEFEKTLPILAIIRTEIKIDEEMANKFKECFGNFIKIYKDSKIPIITRRVKYLFFRQRPPDIVLDLAIAFEILMGTGAEITFKLAINTASLLGKSQAQKSEIYGDIKNFYKLRSDIIHGRDYEGNFQKLGGITFIEKIFNYLRDVFVIYLDVVAQGKKFKEFIENQYFQS